MPNLSVRCTKKSANVATRTGVSRSHFFNKQQTQTVVCIVATMIFIVLPVTINLITGEFSTGVTIAISVFGLIVVVIPLVAILGAVPLMTSNSKVRSDSSTTGVNISNNSSPIAYAQMREVGIQTIAD